MDRLSRWLLDADGDIYGDERERQHWYEGIAVAASIQWILIPWVAGVALWVQGADVAWLVGVIAAALYLPMIMASGYVGRHRVRLYPEQWSTKRIVLMVLGSAPYLLLAAGFLRLSEPGRAVWVGIIIGGAAGLAFAQVMTRRDRDRDSLDGELEDVG